MVDLVIDSNAMRSPFLAEASGAYEWPGQNKAIASPTRREGSRNGVLARPEAKGRVIDGLRRTHGRILNELREDGHIVITVCSALAGEGKTTVAVSLAEMLSEDYNRQTLLIDGDLQRPQLHSLLDLESGVGLKECLSYGTLLTHSIQRSGTLWVMPAGSTPLEPEALSLDNQRSLLDKLRTLFRVVIVDLPAVFERPQGALLSLFADSVVWVVRADSSPVDVVTDAMDMVGRERILSVVLNGERSRLPRWLGRLV